MNKKRILKFIIFFVVFLIFLLRIQPNIYAVTETGSINFVAVDSKTKKNISNLSVDIYQIGIQNKDGDFEYSIGFEESNLNIDTFTKENINTIEDYAMENAKPFETKNTNMDGSFILSNLQKGVYLFVQRSNLDTYNMQTMLLQIPEVDEEGNENYIISVKPKITETEDFSDSLAGEGLLPGTGVLNWPVPILVIIALILFSIGWLKIYTSSKKKNKLSIILVGLATILIIIAGGILIYNNIEENRVRESNKAIVFEFESNMDSYAEINDEGKINKDLSWLDSDKAEGTEYSKNIEGITYIGILYFPSVENLSIPVIDNLSDSLLKISSCRYSGRMSDSNMIIAGHNYNSIFGKLSSNLVIGDKIYFKDLAGTTYKYELINIETLLPTDVEKMQQGNWDLTIFTCTYDNQNRITFRFDLVNQI